MIKLYIYN